RDTTQTTWLADGNRVALIAADSALAEVSPQGDAILYVAHGAAFYRALMRTSPQELSKAVEEARLEAYRTQARQIATALLMYVQDYDMCFPPAYGDEQVALVLLPYLKDPKLFEVDGAFAFRYLLNGESIAQMDSQVDTVVGYLQLPDGRMVIYADGHVKWEPQQ
ncbi:MAG: hypothetical protein NZ874_03355, partial [Fimbriimonadales bacterium]|nr:hypothetical protein [Fimbriimonadales bacterium]